MTTALHVLAHPGVDPAVLDRCLRSVCGLPPRDPGDSGDPGEPVPVRPADHLVIGTAAITPGGVDHDGDAARALADRVTRTWANALADVRCRLHVIDLGGHRSFANARNALFATTDAEWRGWVDSDDMVPDAAAFAALPGDAPDLADVITCPYIYSWRAAKPPADGEGALADLVREAGMMPVPTHVQTRERWLRYRATPDGRPLWRWRGRVHETIQRQEPNPDPACVQHAKLAIWHMGHEENDPAYMARKRDRNAELLVATVWDKSEPDEERDRARAYLALDCLLEADPKREGAVAAACERARDVLLPAYGHTTPDGSGPWPDVIGARRHIVNATAYAPVRDIALLCIGSPVEWHARSPEQEGCGGSEEAAVFLARELASRGLRVTVYGTSRSEDLDGVAWRLGTEWRTGETRHDLVIVWRLAQVGVVMVLGQRAFLWAHDVAVGACGPVDLARFDAILTLSGFQEECLQGIYRGAWLAPFARIGNGLPDHAFTAASLEQSGRDPHRVVYGSSPDRGLDRLLDLWPEVRAAVPDAALDIFYGWNVFDRVVKAAPPERRTERLAYQALVMAQVDALRDHGVTWRGRVDQRELAAAMAASGVWAFPTGFSEVFCITAARAEAAGLTPVCTDAGSLPEVVSFPDELVPIRHGRPAPSPEAPDEPPWTDEVREAFLTRLVAALREPEPESLRRARSEIVRTRHLWRHVADRLIDLTGLRVTSTNGTVVAGAVVASASVVAGDVDSSTIDSSAAE